MSASLDDIYMTLKEFNAALDEIEKTQRRTEEKVDHILTMATVVNAIFDKVAALPDLEKIKEMIATMHEPSTTPPTVTPPPAEPERVPTAAEAWQKMVEEGKA